MSDSSESGDDSPNGDDSATSDDVGTAERTYETRVPVGESPATCPYCERPLEGDTLLVLHEGLNHWERLSDEEREAFREAYRDENDDIRTFRLKTLGLLILIYFGFLFVYSYVTSDPFAAAVLVAVSETGPTALHS